jgi:hypothetical protein
MAYLPENHYCHRCGEYLGPDDGDADCGGHEDEEIEVIELETDGHYHSCENCGVSWKCPAPDDQCEADEERETLCSECGA